MLRPEQKKKLIGHQIKFDSFPYEISMEIGWPYKKILNSGSLIPKNVKNKKFLPPFRKKYSNLLGNPDGRKLCKNYIKYRVI